MEIVVAKSSGFCFGVDRAVKTAFDVQCEGRVFTLGELIHNSQVIETLRKKGIEPIHDLEELRENDCVIIRAHGIGKDVYEKLKECKVTVLDATCPYVKRIHEIVNRKQEEGFKIVIVGDPQHPEVKGINGWCEGKALIVSDERDAENLDYSDERICAVAQTTFRQSRYDAIFETLKKKFAFALKFDTICNATVERQTEAAELSKVADAMVVIGGWNSSNTQKLYEICRQNCPQTYLIENADELPSLNNIKTVGITAGASTPDWVIKEVILHMEDMTNRQEGEIDFSKALEESFTELRTNDVVKGKIIGYNNNDVFVDLGYKADGIIPMEEFIDDPDFDPERDLKPGTEIEAIITKLNDGEGNVALSKKKMDSIRGFEELEDAFKNEKPIEVTAKEVVKGGLVAEYKGMRIFIPASQVSDRFIKNLSPFVGKKIRIRITELANRRRIVGSARLLIEEEKNRKSEAFWNEVEEGKEYTGTVKSLTKFGAFVDLGGVDGLIHVSELSWKKIDDPSEVLKVGDTVTVRVIGVDREKKKVSLGYRKAEDNPWYNIEEKYHVGDVVTGIIKRMVPFGAFVELEDGVEGLVHISQISNVRINKPDEVLSLGQKVDMKVIEVNPEIKKISLSIKEVSPIDPVREDEEAPEAAEEDIPTEHTEEMTNTIGDLINEKK
ncbi:MAG TPA: bifunctional 4-hydroxy-3-methylbut-2-enyl diphosphate reductase/30S ribosomal protein S1 [Thermoclostridium sp.]|nr:bifunctional 4-hydroxy-3-methylbut-2-enyl diphosphate reductase/30S ribosomal protein S1 [Clostridiaceae bacterium]HOQ76427.1 bifunctional 4-hydroxy-3-methylbut-2-enyl diphosphate reductase/30S ribosomal protein S1 [Thermoclostridium sp.]HPU45106.1 bifunctional 4-hydroxy-3-methylbut-2-enyl diphosphate reductase/30S ribosomal protein S1 [Thermoclostridium sp.]